MDEDFTKMKGGDLLEDDKGRQMRCYLTYGKDDEYAYVVRLRGFKDNKRAPVFSHLSRTSVKWKIIERAYPVQVVGEHVVNGYGQVRLLKGQ